VLSTMLVILLTIDSIVAEPLVDSSSSLESGEFFGLTVVVLVES